MYRKNNRESRRIITAQKTHITQQMLYVYSLPCTGLILEWLNVHLRCPKPTGIGWDLNRSTKVACWFPERWPADRRLSCCHHRRAICFPKLFVFKNCLYFLNNVSTEIHLWQWLEKIVDIIVIDVVTGQSSHGEWWHNEARQYEKGGSYQYKVHDATG